MRKIIGLFVGIMMCLVVFSVLPGNAFGDLEKPTYHVGDEWKYTMTETEAGMSGTIIMRVTGSTTITANETNYDVWSVEWEGNGTFVSGGMSGTWTITNSVEYCKKSDFATVKRVMNMNMSGTYGTYSFSSLTHNETTYNPPIGASKTIHVGDQWSVSSTATSYETMHMEFSEHPELTQDTSKNSTYDASKSYICLKKETVAVTAGTFDTYVVKSTSPDGSYDMDYLCSKVGSAVKSESYNSDGENTMTIELVLYSYTGLEEEGVLGEKLAGIPVLYWLVIIVIVIVIVIAVVALKRKKKMPAPPSPPQTGQPPAPPMPPQTSQPSQPPQQPPVSPPKPPQ